MRSLGLEKFAKGAVYSALVLFSTFLAAYIPLFLDDNASRSDMALGGLMGFLFSVLLAIGHRISDQFAGGFDALNERIAAQGHSIQLQEAYLQAKEGPYSALFGRLAKSRLMRIQKSLDDMVGDIPSYTIKRLDPVREYIDIFVEMMLEIIYEGSEFRVVSNEIIWSATNFGEPSQRYLRANWSAVHKRKIRINRIFAVEEIDVEASGWTERGLNMLGMLKKHIEILEPDGSNADLSVFEIPTNERHGFFQSPSSNFAIWNVSATLATPKEK